MDKISVVKINGWGGDVVPGDPVDGDLVRITYSNGAVVEKIYWDIEIPEPPVVDQEVLLRGSLRRLINANTAKVIADFTYGDKTYNLTPDVINQVKELAALLLSVDDPSLYFPVEVVVGDDDGYDSVATINSASLFKTVYESILSHIKSKRDQARTLKLQLDLLDLSELKAWTDPRL